MLRMSVNKSIVAILLISAMLLVTAIVAFAEKIEVTLWHHWDGERMDLVQKVLDDFMAENPDIEVKQLFSPPTSNADRLMTFLLGGSAPEVVMVNSSFALQISNMGGFLPLDEFIDRDNVDVTMFNDADLRGFQLRGSTYGLPVMSGIAWTNIMFHNKQLMDEAGLDSNSPPKTWVDWMDASARMTRRSGDGQLTQIGSHMPSTLWTSYLNGADMWGDDWRTARVNTERVAETATFLQDFAMTLYGSYEEYLSFWGTGFDLAFYRGQSGFWRQNSSGFLHMQNFDIDWGASLAPINGNNPDARPTSLVLSTWAYAIPSFTPPEKIEASWKLLNYLTTHEDAAGWFARIQGRPSPVMAFNTHRDYLDNNPYWDVVIESANHVELAPPVHIQVMTQFFRRIERGQVHPQQALEDAELALQNELDNYWRVMD